MLPADYSHSFPAVCTDAEGHATLCDFGASFLYTPEPGLHLEACEVRALGLMLRDLAERGGPRVAWICQDLVPQCCATDVAARPTFKELGNQFEAELMQVCADTASIPS